MNRPPIGEARLAEILAAAAAAQTPVEALQRFNEAKVVPYQIRVRFNEDPANEHAFWVIAKRGPMLLMYDDVEEYFSTGVPDSDGILRSWDNIEPQDRLDGAVTELMGDGGT